MSDSRNIQAIKAHIDAFTHGDIDAICLQCTEDVIWNPPVSRGLVPYNSTGTGRGKVRDYCTGLMGSLEWSAFDVPVLRDAPPEHVIMLATESFTVRATGKKVDNVLLTLFRMRDGLISEFHLCENTELVAAAFLPEPA
jgi:ketosteroid isomerase-like protein